MMDTSNHVVGWKNKRGPKSAGTSIGREALTSDDVRLHIEHPTKVVLSKLGICG
jgi:hypothetical protein